MKHHMSFRLRKNVSNKGSMKKMLSVRNCSTSSSMVGFPPLNSLGRHIHKCVQALISPCIVLSPRLLQGLATIMGSLEDLLVDQADIPQVEQVGDTTTLIVVVKVVVVMVVGHILHRGELHHMAQVVCLVHLHMGVEGVVAMELVVQIILKVVHLMVVLVLVVVRT